MRLPLDSIYRPSNKEQSHQAFVSEIQEQLHRAYDTTRERLHFAHQNQKDYYHRRTHGERFKVKDSVWLWSPVLEKGVAPKFHDPWTGSMKINKSICDVKYKVHDLSKNFKKTVHFDRLRKAAIKPRRNDLSESDPEDLITNDSESDTSSPAAAIRLVHKPTARNAPNPAEKRAKTLWPQTTEMAERVVKDQAPMARSPVRVPQELT